MIGNLLHTIQYAIGTVIGFVLLCILLYIFFRVISMAVLNSYHDHQKRSEDNGTRQGSKKKN